VSSGRERRERQIARRMRVVAVVIAGTMLLWLGANLAGRQLGLPGRYAVLFDLLALAGFVWSMVVIYQIWRARRQD